MSTSRDDRGKSHQSFKRHRDDRSRSSNTSYSRGQTNYNRDNQYTSENSNHHPCPKRNSSTFENPSPKRPCPPSNLYRTMSEFSNISSDETSTEIFTEKQKTTTMKYNYRHLPIIPDISELLSEQQVFLRKNIIDDIYKNAEQYLDIHFRLLREDFLGPLRDGIRHYLSKSQTKNFNVQVYENVQFIDSRLNAQNGLVYDLRLDSKMTKKIFWSKSRRLIYGNLLLLSSDNFNTCAFFTVADRSNIEKGSIISVKKFENSIHSEQSSINLDQIDSSTSLTMIETKNYFEAYRPILNALQMIPTDDQFPLAQSFLKLTTKQTPPDYLTSTTTYDFTPLLDDLDSPVYKSVPILSKDEWPTSEKLKLNPKQYKALTLALTNKVALIQGPPGTGKTYIGVRITQMLIHNRRVWCNSEEQSTPILMICHTNHALDQFLELIDQRLKLRNGIIRIGSRCQNETIQQFSLKNARRSAPKTEELCSRERNLSKKATYLKDQQNKLKNSQTNAMPLSLLMDYALIDERHYFWLAVTYDSTQMDRALSDWLDLKDKNEQIQLIIGQPTTLDDETVQQIPDNTWMLSLYERYDLYRYWLSKYQQYLQSTILDASKAYEEAVSSLEEYRQEEDYRIIKKKLIVAMTTTGAAKQHKLLQKLQCRIVIVEEAAAIFEAHIITALNPKCEHLILIGDHIQLRPNPNVYDLTVKYHFDVSLFERFIRNNLPNVQLNIQHRMRPEIARLMKHFYDDLNNYPSVSLNRFLIDGICSSLFFIDHNHPETSVKDESSKRNEYEGNYIIELAKYLRRQGYESKQITILAMYRGQKQFIVSKVKNEKSLHGIRIMVTDDYQGEENDIILLSLVRSNDENRIGFLGVKNRICVALSRARCGLYIIGNRSILEKNKMWMKIFSTLSENNSVGKGLWLYCCRHPNNKLMADKPESFALRCSRVCEARLPCDHRCQSPCHSYDYEHCDEVCRQPCMEQLPCGHLCKANCHFETSNKHATCYISVEKIIPECDHKIRVQCCDIPTAKDCKNSTLKQLACGHSVDIPCRILSSIDEFKRFSCPIPCSQILACKHKCTGTCGHCQAGQLHIACQKICERELICSHICQSFCAGNCPPCLHECRTTCGELCIPCKKPCAYRCKHLQCTRLCSEPCNRAPCNKPCYQKLRCGHTCIGMCGEPCPNECRICHKQIVQNRLLDSKNVHNARFVLLPDCGHIVEVHALDRFIEDFRNNSMNELIIRFPECPHCRQKIYRCRRYMSVLNERHQWIFQMKKKILEDHSQEIINQRQRILIDNYEDMINNFKEIHLEKSFEDLFSLLYKKKDFLNDDMLTLMTNTILFLKQIDELLVDGRKQLQRNIFKEFISEPLYRVVKYLSQQKRDRNLSEQQIKDIQRELERIHGIVYIETLASSLKQQTLNINEKQAIDSMQSLTKKFGPFKDEDKQTFDNLVEEYKYLTNLPNLGINDHPYIITEV